MTRPLFFTALAAQLLLLTACSPGTTAQGKSTPKTDPVPATASAKPTTAGTEYEFTFGFRGGTAAQDPRIVRTEDSPCGDLPVARVKSIPLGDKVLVADPVVEFNEAGQEIARWGKPNGAEVLAIDGGRLQFTAGSDRYWTDPKGTIERAAATAAKSDGEFLSSSAMFSCPTLPTFPSIDGSQQCFRVRDAAGRQRLIALEGVCS